MRASNRRLPAVLAGLSALGLAGSLLAATPSARLVYGALYMEPIIELGPCLFTVALPANRDQGCIPWTRRETAGPAFHPPSGVVVVGGSDGKLHGVSALDGGDIYAVPLPGQLVSKPVLRGPRAYFGTDDGYVLRSDVTSGRVSWQSQVDAEVIEPVVVSGDSVYAVTGLDSVYAFDAATGEARWVHKHSLPRGITVRGQARPLVATVQLPGGAFEQRVYVGHASGTVFALEPETGEPLQQVELGRAEAFNDVDTDPVYQAGNVIVASYATGLTALDPVTLAQRWSVEEKGIVGLAHAGPFMVVAAGAGVVLGIDARNGSIRWRFEFDRGSPTRPAIKGGRVHVGSDRGPLYVLDLFSGRPLQYYGSGLGIAADLDLSGDMLFLMSTAGTLHALSNDFRGRVQRD